MFLKQRYPIEDFVKAIELNLLLERGFSDDFRRRLEYFDKCNFITQRTNLDMRMEILFNRILEELRVLYDKDCAYRTLRELL